MGKTRAEIQKSYRERKKQKEGEAYLEQERKRIKQYYVPISERTEKDAKTRREKVRICVQKHRDRKKTHIMSEKDEEIKSEACSSKSEDDTASSCSGLLKVKMPFPLKNKSRKRISRAVSQCHRDIDSLKKENLNLLRKYKKVTKQNERLRKRYEIDDEKTLQLEETLEDSFTKDPNSTGNKKTVNTDPCMRQLTPRKRVSTELTGLGLSPSKVPKKVKDTMLMAHVVASELDSTRKANGQKGKSLIAKVLSGKVIKKYRLAGKLNRYTGISKKILLKNSDKKLDKMPVIEKRVQKRELLRQKVRQFLLRDDNSRMMPGKNDKVKESGRFEQKRVLNDSLGFLHKKYNAETETNIAFSTFCRLRPKTISLTRYITRNTCLCQKHQNVALMLKAVRTAGGKAPANPDEFARQLDENAILDDYTEGIGDTIHYEQWRKVTMPDGKKRTRIVGADIGKEEFVKIFREQSIEFKDHVLRIKTQYKAMKNLKENMPEGHCIAQMDFAENFSCNSADEVQSAYWNSNAVSLHPVVVYYRENNVMKHFNHVFVSDDLGHNIGAVYAILKRLIPKIKETVGQSFSKVHYWTDGPSSQYKNKTSFYIVSAHKELFGVDAEWNFWESGHGKGPCDGVGGTAKRMAELSIKQGKVCIQDAHDFYEWGKRFHTNAEYTFVPESENNTVRNELNEINQTLMTVKGTMKVHNVSCESKGVVRTKITSCYCTECIAGNNHDYLVRKLIKDERESKGIDASSSERNKNLENTDSAVPEDIQPYEEFEWVAVYYDDTWHIGQILEVDPVDQDCRVSFLRKATAVGNKCPTFKWATPVDEMWVKFTSIITKIEEPSKVGRSGRSMQVPQTELDLIQQEMQLM